MTVFSDVTGWGAQKMLVSVHISANVHHQNDAFLSFRYNLISVHHTVNNFSFSVKKRAVCIVNYKRRLIIYCKANIMINVNWLQIVGIFLLQTHQFPARLSVYECLRTYLSKTKQRSKPPKHEDVLSCLVSLPGPAFSAVRIYSMGPNISTNRKLLLQHGNIIPAMHTQK